MILNQLPTNIKYYRTRNNWTQQQLADKLSISRSVIAKWENGDVTPDLHAIAKLSIIFEQSIDHLVGLDSQTNDQLSEFHQLYQAKTNQSQEYYNDLVWVSDYITKNTILKEQIFEMQQLPLKKQKAIHRIMKGIIGEAKHL
ncbi:helix-turn-helix domain-containing protein [Paraliobacillus salinarum]|uniref:helix-turn-helix domain-containing protein n=1 Tax=Paraliobacillus salinarum TaxID=1158996 RepID=UPI0015F508C0|nr:helix-turn-helix transcriptional regulator [Paraliobacillus salinarum]